MSAPEKTAGQVCFDAYFEGLEGERHYRPWDKRSPAVQARWERAALAMQGLEVVAVVRPRKEKA